jgi:hypothetical protein
MRVTTSFVLTAMLAMKGSNVLALPVNMASENSLVEREVSEEVATRGLTIDMEAIEARDWDESSEIDSRDFEEMSEVDAREWEEMSEYDARDFEEEFEARGILGAAAKVASKAAPAVAKLKSSMKVENGFKDNPR